MQFLNTATIRLENDFAPSISLHGCMVDMRGVGVLMMGDSGSGKSETAVGLLERGPLSSQTIWCESERLEAI